MVRRRVLDTARRLFAQNGYEGMQMATVAQEAEIGRSRLYELFPDRRAVLTALVEHDVEQLIGRLTLGIEPGAPIGTMLRQGYTVFLDFVDERRAEYELLFGHAGRLDPEVATLLRDLRERLATAYMRLFRPAVEASGLPWPAEAEARLVTHAVIALAEGGVQAWLTEPVLDRQRVVEILAQMTWQVMASSKTPPANVAGDGATEASTAARGRGVLRPMNVQRPPRNAAMSAVR